MNTNEAKKFNLLIKEIALKQKNALETFYNFYGKFIYASAYSITKSSFYADEVLDDVLIKIWNVSASLSGIDNPRGWLYIVTVNCAKDKMRYVNKIEFVAEGGRDRETNEEEMSNILDNDSFYSLISSLNEIEQQILILRFVEDLSFKSISKELQMPMGTVTACYYRALKKIEKKKLI